MSRISLPIKKLNDKTKNWTTLIQVVERTHVNTSKNDSSVLYRRFLFTDEEGTKVSAVAYNHVINQFTDMLLPYKRYYLTGIAPPEKASFKVGDYDYNWLLVNGTYAEDFMESIPPQFPCHIELHRFEDLHKFADTGHLKKLQAYFGVVVHALPVKKSGENNTSRDLVIINEVKKPLLLTLWNQFETQEGQQLETSMSAGNILLTMRVKAYPYQQKSDTCLLINPPMAATVDLKQWYIDNKDDVARLVSEEAYKNTNFLFPPPKHSDIISIQNALRTIKNIKTCWISGRLDFVVGNRALWYTACNNCHKTYNVPHDTAIKCRGCQKEAYIEARCRIPIAINDGTGIVNVIAYGEDAEKLIPFNGIQMEKI
ncbi:Unknown protein [Striga hermonthica]|uniref:Replication factor A C-terminal domain-containing protein n=1 Tax=Striga hermonthica TaxID=68872 RepID=A0A9N7RDL1_STRHE|nr:Unknown protein [Striga hermonthica]